MSSLSTTGYDEGTTDVATFADMGIYLPYFQHFAVIKNAYKSCRFISQYFKYYPQMMYIAALM